MFQNESSDKIYCHGDNGLWLKQSFMSKCENQIKSCNSCCCINILIKKFSTQWRYTKQFKNFGGKLTTS